MVNSGMSDEAVALTDDEFSVLLEVAHCALDSGLHDEARALLQVLAVLRAENPHPRIGLALVNYVSGDRIGAIQMLTDLLPEFPDAVFTRSLLAKFMKESGSAGWETYARESLDLLDTGVAAEMARSLLNIPVPDVARESAETAEASSPSTNTTGARAIDVFLGRRA